MCRVTGDKKYLVPMHINSSSTLLLLRADLQRVAHYNGLSYYMLYIQAS